MLIQIHTCRAIRDIRRREGCRRTEGPAGEAVRPGGGDPPEAVEVDRFNATLGESARATGRTQVEGQAQARHAERGMQTAFDEVFGHLPYQNRFLHTLLVDCSK